MSELNMNDAALDQNWDDIQDLPDFADLPAGSFLMLVTKAETATFGKDENAKPGIRVSCDVAQVVEAPLDPNRPDILEVPVGTKTSFSFIDADFAVAVQKFKKQFGDVGKTINANTPRELLDMLPGITVGVVTSTSKVTKDGQVKVYTNLKSVHPT